MKNKIYILLGFFLIVNLQSEVRAQAILHTTIFSVSNSTPSIGEQLNVSIQIQNVSLIDTFSGIINFDLANKDSIIENLSIVGYPNYNGTFITLAPLEIRGGLFTVQIIAPNFVVGPDIIIVWPIAPAVILDSARTSINIQAPLGIRENEKEKISLWLNNDELLIWMKDLEIGLQGVRIFSMNGQVVVNQQLYSGKNSIPIESLPAGVYVAEIKRLNGEVKRIKWVK